MNAVGTDAATRDIGAYEVQNAAPIANLAVLTADPQTGYPVNFSAAGSSEPDGDVLTYVWSFDDGTTTAGPTAERLWQTAGIQTVRLTVTDSTGLDHSDDRPGQRQEGLGRDHAVDEGDQGRPPGPLRLPPRLPRDSRPWVHAPAA